MDAACRLFFTKGYHGTSVRDIAKSASINVSLINYYFNSKQGLLESIVTCYYEQYLGQLEAVITDTKAMPKLERLKKMIAVIIQYKQAHHQFTCFIHRELTLDSIFVREMMVTYLAKENYLLSSVFNESLQRTSHTNLDMKFLFIQFKGMLSSPFSSPNEWRNFLEWNHSQDFFAKKYTSFICSWIDHLASENRYEERGNIHVQF